MVDIYIINIDELKCKYIYMIETKQLIFGKISKLDISVIIEKKYNRVCRNQVKQRFT